MESRFELGALLGNVMFCLLLATFTVMAFERWTRRDRRFQLSLGSLINAVMVAAVLLSILSGAIDMWLNPFEPLIFGWHDLLLPQRWPLLLALACTIYTMGWPTWHLVFRWWAYSPRHLLQKSQGD